MKRKMLWLIMAVIAVLIMVPVGAGKVYAIEADTDIPEIDNSTLQVILPEGKTEVTVGDSVKVSAKVTDESGVKSVEFIYEYPNSTNYRTCYTSYNEETDRYETVIPITEDTPSGECFIRFITVKDNKNNYGQVWNKDKYLNTHPNLDLSAGNFTVYGTNADTDIPTIDVETLKVELPEGKTEVTAGDSVKVSAKVTDESGVKSVEFIYEYPNSTNYRTCYTSYNEKTDRYETVIPITEDTPSGECFIRFITVKDIKNNYGQVWNSAEYPNGHPNLDLSAGNFTVYGTNADTDIPTIDVETLKVELPEGKTAATAGDSVKVSAKVTDDSGVNSVEFIYEYPNSTNYQTCYTSYNEETDRYETVISITEDTPSGGCFIRFITVKDNKNNYGQVWNSAEYPNSHPNLDLSAGNFTVTKNCKISFDTKGGNEIEPRYVVPGSTFSTSGITPLKDGFFFGGWYLDEELTDYFYNNSVVNEDITLYAKWSTSASIGSYDATNEKDMAGGMFSVKAGEYEQEQTYGWMVLSVNPGDTCTFKAYPDKGNVFKGWYEGRVEDVYKDGMIYTQIILPKDLNDPTTLLSEDITYEKKIDQNFVVCAVFEKCKDHKLGEELVKKATFTEDGYTYAICELCGEEEKGMPILKGGNVSIEATSFEYTGKAVTPKVTVTNYDGELPSDYYDVEYKDNVNPGTAKVIVTLKGKYYEGSTELTFEIKKADSGKDKGKEKSANTLNAKLKTATVKYKKLRKKTQKLAATKVIKFVNKGQGKLSYKLVSAKKGKKNFKKYIKVNSKTGKVTVKKGLKKGVYKVKIKVKAAGNADYKASDWKTVTFKIKVK